LKNGWRRALLGMSSEIIFEVTRLKRAVIAVGAGLWHYTQAETLEELRTMVRDAVNCFLMIRSRRPK